MNHQSPILVTGGAGYIGSHTCVALLAAGYRVVVLDDFSNSHPVAMERVRQLSPPGLEVVRGDVRDSSLVARILREHGCQRVIHFAGLKAVAESVEQPLEYYSANVAGALSLLRAMRASGVKSLVFSSSATVYGEPRFLPITEDHPLSATNPYGRTKLFIEEMLRDLQRAEPAWRVVILRYFNPVGAHVSGLLGEAPRGLPNNLMPYVAQVAVGRLERLSVWGDDYPTPDGTGVRDYIHVMDLAEGHVRALEGLANPGCVVINLGTGRGYSVLEVIRAFEEASGCPIPYVVGPRRSGDVAACYADAGLAARWLGWRARRTLQAMCADHWRWQRKNPGGYGGGL